MKSFLESSLQYKWPHKGNRNIGMKLLLDKPLEPKIAAFFYKEKLTPWKITYATNVHCSLKQLC